MRWPFGPPHLTLKKQTKKQKKTTKNKKKQKKTKKTKQKQKTRKKQEKNKNELFNYQSKFSFLGGCPKFPFLTTWPKKRAPQNNIETGVSAFSFLKKKICVTKRPFLDQKKPKSRKFHFAVSNFCNVQEESRREILNKYQNTHRNNK